MPTTTRYAVIDLGTNTFHLLIAEANSEGHFKEILRERRFVKLAEEGIEQIGPGPYRRGMETLKLYRQWMDEMEVKAIAAIGTAALRTATNGPEFVREAAATVGIQVELISGDKEARLIYEGVKLAMPPLPGNVLIMDIGGGSVEFILAGPEGVHWAQSFPIGVAVLFRQFHHRDPIAKEEIAAIRTFLNQQLQPLKDRLRAFPTTHLIGAAGTFDVIAGSISKALFGPYIEIDLSGLPTLYHRLVDATKEEREAMPDIPTDRVDMIVAAMILIDEVMQLAGITQLSVSMYSMKEGMLKRLMDRLVPG